MTLEGGQLGEVLTAVTLCAWLTSDLLAIAKFLVQAFITRTHSAMILNRSLKSWRKLLKIFCCIRKNNYFFLQIRPTDRTARPGHGSVASWIFMKCLERHVKLHLSLILFRVAVDELRRIQCVFHGFLVQTHQHNWSQMTHLDEDKIETHRFKTLTFEPEASIWVVSEIKRGHHLLLLVTTGTHL